MIVANVRGRLRRADAELVVRLIARGSEQVRQETETVLADRGLDPLLDDARLLDGLYASRQGAHASLPLFSYTVVRHALRAVGDDDRTMADYVAAIVLHFGLRQRALQLGEHDDATYGTLAELAAESESGDSQRALQARAHMGNYALWLSGLFPDHIEHRRWRRGGPDLDYFDAMGQRGFSLAADHKLAHQHGLRAVFAAAAERFPTLRLALNRVSDRILFPGVHSPERLMRQVRDESRWLRH